jgi:uncharacterized protein with PIN domain
MLTLEEHNQAVISKVKAIRKFGHPNNIKCPKCGEELHDTYGEGVRTSNPPQYCIHCNACNYKGLRF